MSQVEHRPVATEADVSRIAAIGNRVIRNLEITNCYADLSAAFRARTGAGADWCTFATWASRQAGSTIRGEDLLERIERRLGRRSWMLAPLQSLSRMLLRKGLFEQETTFGRVIAAIHTPFDALERSSAAVAEGNLKVFEEIGREFARFLATVPVDARPDSADTGRSPRAFVQVRRRTDRITFARPSRTTSSCGSNRMPPCARDGSCSPT